jgi:hypothetical protein
MNIQVEKILIRNKLLPKFKIGVLVLLAMLLFTLVGCGNYRGFTVHTATANFSFEYSSIYFRPSLDQSREDYTEVFASRRSEGRQPPDGYLSITAFKTNDSYPDYHALLEDHLRNAQLGLKEDEFRVAERSLVVVDGAHGVQVIYSYMNYLYADHFSTSSQRLEISYEAYLENNGFLWDITVHSIADVAEQSKADFEHILTSFKFLK